MSKKDNNIIDTIDNISMQLEYTVMAFGVAVESLARIELECDGESKLIAKKALNNIRALTSEAFDEDE